MHIQKSFVTKKHKDFGLISSSCKPPTSGQNELSKHFNRVDTYTCKMTVGLKLKQPNSSEVFPVCVCVCSFYLHNSETISYNMTQVHKAAMFRYSGAKYFLLKVVFPDVLDKINQSIFQRYLAVD